ncbi:SPRY domain-containing protein [Luteimonas qiangzhengi]|uniref:SPRY domain-containing protein n=1 Tax=Luteimonas sp. MJ146 TaxID=3129240 RepID=UPI0031BAF6D3
MPTVTWNTGDKSPSIVLSGGDLIATKTGSNEHAVVRATHKVVGRKYFEIYISSVGRSPFMVVGVTNPGASLSDYIGAGADGWGYYQETGNKLHEGDAGAYGASFAGLGTVIGVAVDADAGEIEFFRDGVSQGVAFTNLSGDLFPAASLWLGSGGHIIGGRFKSETFSHTPPAGYGPMGG